MCGATPAVSVDRCRVQILLETNYRSRNLLGGSLIIVVACAFMFFLKNPGTRRRLEICRRLAEEASSTFITYHVDTPSSCRNRALVSVETKLGLRTLTNLWKHSLAPITTVQRLGACASPEHVQTYARSTQPWRHFSHLPTLFASAILFDVSDLEV